MKILKYPFIIVVFILILTCSILSGCINSNQDENIKNSNSDNLDLLLTSNQNYYKTNSSNDIIINISLKNKKRSPVYIEKHFDFKYTLNYEISGISNDYFEEYEGPIADYQPIKKILNPNDKVELQFILMNKVRFDKIFLDFGQETYGNYTFKVTYSSAFTTGIINSNEIEFELIDKEYINLPPVIYFIEDNYNDKVIDRNIKIKWFDEDLDDNAKINIFYDFNDKGIDGAQINIDTIFEDDDKDTFEWNVSNYKEGFYYLYLVISENNNYSYDYIDNPIKIEHSNIQKNDTIPPIVIITSPHNNSKFGLCKGDSLIHINVTANDISGISKINFYFKQKSEFNFSDESEMGFKNNHWNYIFDISIVVDGEYIFKVEAFDNSNNRNIGYYEINISICN